MQIRPALLLRLAVVLFFPLVACSPAKTLYHHTFDDLGKAAQLFNELLKKNPSNAMSAGTLRLG